MKKICKCCGRNRKIGKFGKKTSNPDGKNIYCRDCMRKITKKYKSSQKGKLIQQKCNEKWKKNNKNAIKKYNKEYYKKKKHIILYNKKAKEETECILITENSKKCKQLKINKDRKIDSIKINPKRIKNGNSIL